MRGPRGPYVGRYLINDVAAPAGRVRATGARTMQRCSWCTYMSALAGAGRDTECTGGMRMRMRYAALAWIMDACMAWRRPVRHSVSSRCAMACDYVNTARTVVAGGMHTYPRNTHICALIDRSP
ncbi:hypothetical protein GUJ93_ZPchr0002g25827 [Zizania palustris]|uniref:Uncharacterized protein n=1 Tax=Zizania palustris TaxID=103762 RepID=A0A8J5VGL4_ZIZPA|nr:hypothetical protein GUJ93_ZPchr0002g25827 [Zizania palustris]